MDILTSLGIVGESIADESNNRTNKRNHMRRIKRNTRNIYDNNNVQETREYVDNIARKRYQDSKQPEQTGVIPPFYNHKRNGKINMTESDSEFSDNNTEHFDNNIIKSTPQSPRFDPNIAPDAFYKECDRISNNRAYEAKMAKQPERGFHAQFDEMTFDNPGDPISSNRLTHERNIAIGNNHTDYKPTSDMTYNVVDAEHFTHNNMTPFFSGRSYGFNPDDDNAGNSIKQQKLDRFSGSVNNLDWRPKTERRPLFNPTADMTNIYGMPNMTDYFESRYIPSRYRRNEKPFQETKVTPGVGLGANENGKHGFHYGYHRPLPKTVDDLRTSNNPKLSYTAPVKAGQKAKNGPLPVKVFKRRHERFKEGLRENLKGKSRYSGPTMYGEYDPMAMASVYRGTKEVKEYFGPAHEKSKQVAVDMINWTPDTTMRNVHEQTDRVGAGIGNHQQHRPQAFDTTNATPDATMRNIHEQTDRAGHINNRQHNKPMIFDMINNVMDATMRNIHDEPDRVGFINNNQYHKPQAFDMTNATPDTTMRNIHEQYDRAGHLNNNQYHKPQAFDATNATPDTTMRNIHDQPDRAGFINNNQYHKPQAFDQIGATPDTTMRNIHEQYDRAGFINNNQYNKPQQFNNINATPDTTMRNIHDAYDRAGFINNNQYNKPQAFDATNATPDTTMRNIHEQYDRAGFINNNQYNKPQVFDMINNIMDATMRNIHDQTDRAGFINNNQYHKPQAFDSTNATPDATMRNIHDQYDRAGHMNNGQYNKPQAFDATNATPDATMRNIHDQYDRAGHMNNGQYNKPQAFDKVNATPDATMRNIHDEYDRAGFVGSVHEKQTGRGDANNMNVNIMKEIVAKGRAPTQSNYSKGPTIDMTSVALCDQINIWDKRALVPKTIELAERMPFIMATHTNTLPQNSWHFLSHVEENLAGNPYINNVIHQSKYNIE